MKNTLLTFSLLALLCSCDKDPIGDADPPVPNSNETVVGDTLFIGIISEDTTNGVAYIIQDSAGTMHKKLVYPITNNYTMNNADYDPVTHLYHFTRDGLYQGAFNTTTGEFKKFHDESLYGIACNNGGFYAMSTKDNIINKYSQSSTTVDSVAQGSSYVMDYVQGAFDSNKFYLLSNDNIQMFDFQTGQHSVLSLSATNSKGLQLLSSNIFLTVQTRLVG